MKRLRFLCLGLFIFMNTYAENISYKTLKLYKNHPIENSSEFNSKVLKSRLAELQERSDLDVQHNAILEYSINAYLKNQKNDVANLIDKSKLYFPIFEKYLAKYDLPEAIKYLAVVESRLKPNARSYMGAKGLWQFMPYTGIEYGLKINRRVDERLDPIKATEAACKYLSNLYKQFGDWNLALAAYNSGPGNVRKAIRRSGGYKDFWKIRKYLPKETRDYIPSFYTTFYLFEYAEMHQIYSKEMEISFDEIRIIEVQNKLTFKEIQGRFNIDSKLLAQLNPQYKYGIIPFIKNDKNYLILPNSVVNQFTPCKSEVYELAKKNTMNTSFFLGSVHSEKEEDCNTKGKFIDYIVKKDDSLWRISKQFPKTTINQLKSWNNLWSVSYLKPGSIIKILTD